MAHLERDFARCLNGICNGCGDVSVFFTFRSGIEVFLRTFTEGKYLMKNWYIVQSHSSFENKVASLIKEEADKAKISEKFEEIVVPTHDVTEVKRGKRIQRKKKYFPGYVLIKSEMDNNI